MSIIEILGATQDEQYFENVGKAVGVSAADARTAIGALVPAIAQKLKSTASANSESFDMLLDIIEDDGNSADLAHDEALVSDEAIDDGAAILDHLYGSTAEARAALSRFAPHHTEQLSAFAAVAVVACIAALNAPQNAKLGLASSTKSGGIVATIISALVSGLLKGLLQQLKPKRRRYGSYYKRTSPARRRSTRPNLEDIFREILAPKK